ncbi:MAG: hypothetical protein U5R46_10995 [Gammaproteobacteria bacterium]|nr:hypothetical protein [Gammaproteobacteria bacterium]
MINRILSKYAWLVLVLFLSPVAAFAETQTPIGALTAEGRVTVATPDSRVTLQDQAYAYFANDSIHTGEGARAAVQLNNGLRVTFTGGATGQISVGEGAYVVALQQGDIVIDAEPGVDHRLTHDGKPVSAEQILNADGRPYVASVAEDGNVQFCMPAQLDDEDEAAAGLKNSLERAGLSPGQIAAIIAALWATYEIVDDENSSS